jgi:hypothetical protein
MSGNSRPDGVALEILVFVINALKEHEDQFDQLIAQLCTIREDQTNNVAKLNSKFSEFTEKINRLQKGIFNLKGCVSSVANADAAIEIKNDVFKKKTSPKLAVVLRCSQWADFQNSALQPDTLTFDYIEKEKTFRANALKGNQVVTFSGQTPSLETLLKVWLHEQLEIADLENVVGSSDISNLNKAVAKENEVCSPAIADADCKSEPQGQ